MPIKLNAGLGESPIVKQEIENMKKEYSKKCHRNDAKSCWVSKKELMTLMRQNKANGIRLYYGRHAESTMKKIGVEYKGKHNIILVATIDKINPLKPNTENSVDQLNDDIEKGRVNSVVYTSHLEFKGMGDDYVPLCPPRCPK